MKSYLTILAFPFLILVFIGTTYSQDSKNITFSGSFSEGPCFAVASKDSIIFTGNGTGIDIIVINSNNILTKKSRFDTKFLINDLEINSNILYAATDGGLFLVNIGNIAAPIQLSYFMTVGKCKSLFIKDNFVYLVDDAEGFHIIDVSNPGNPNLISTFQPSATKNLTQICVTDSVAYLCDSMGKLLIINTKEKNNPILLSTYNFGGSYYPTTININNNYAYVGTVNYGVMRYLGKLFTLDISDPKNPKQVSAIETTGDWLSGSRDIIIKDSHLFLSFWSDVIQGVGVYDISNPASPKDLSTYILTSDSYSISVANNNLIVSEGGSGLSIFALGDLSNIKQISTYITCNTINDLFINNNILYSACGSSGFNTYDYSSTKNIIKTTKLKNQLNPSSNCTSVYVDSGYLFLSCTPSYGGGLCIYDTKGTDSFTEVGGGNVEGNKVIVKNNYAYVAASYYGLEIFDISQITKTTMIFELPSDVSSSDIELKDNICFLAITNGVDVFDITNPAKPIELSQFKTDSLALGVAVKDSIVFVAEGAKGVQIFNYKNVSKNKLFNLGFTNLRKVRIEDNYLYVIDDSKGLVSYDISDPFNPVEIGYYRLGKAIATNIFIKDSLICVSQGYYGFSIYKFSLITSVNISKKELPINYYLNQNFPNPFNPTTTINYSIPKSSFVKIKIYDILGREVITLVNENKTIGNYRVQFNANNLVSGVYFYRMQAGDFMQTKKMILLK